MPRRAKPTRYRSRLMCDRISDRVLRSPCESVPFQSFASAATPKDLRGLSFGELVSRSIAQEKFTTKLISITIQYQEI